MTQNLDEISKIRNSQKIISSCLEALSKDPANKIEFFKWGGRPDDWKRHIYRLLVSMAGTLHTIPFLEDELLEYRSVNEWEKNLKAKILTLVEEHERSMAMEQAEDAQNIILQLKSIHGKLADLHLPKKPIEEREDQAVQLFNSLIEYFPFAVYYYDLWGRFLYGNQKSEELCGYKKEELIGKRYFETKLVGIQDLLKTLKILAKNVLAKSTGPDDFTLFRKDGEKRIVEVFTQLMTVGTKKIVLAIALDITDRKMIETERERIIEDLRKTLATTKEAESIVTICSHCKKIRDITGQWRSIESYIYNQAGSQVSHGICPDCFEEYYSDYQPNPQCPSYSNCSFFFKSNETASLRKLVKRYCFAGYQRCDIFQLMQSGKSVVPGLLPDGTFSQGTL